jgi:hypothetical protein
MGDIVSKCVEIYNGNAIRNGDTLTLYRDVGTRSPRYHGFVLHRKDVIKVLQMFDLPELIENEKKSVEELPF